MIKKKKRNENIDINGLSTRIGLFYASKLNSYHKFFAPDLKQNNLKTHLFET